MNHAQKYFLYSKMKNPFPVIPVGIAQTPLLVNEDAYAPDGPLGILKFEVISTKVAAVKSPPGT